MTILALEFSSSQRSVAVWRADRAAGPTEMIETGGQGADAFGMIEKIFAATKTEREEIEVITVGLGPGSYTGIRAAIAVAQGWQLAREVKLLGIGSADALAAQAQAEKFFGGVSAVIDAQRNEFYLAGYEISAGGWREIEPLKILPFAEIQSRMDANEILIGPEAAKWFPKARSVFPGAAMLAQLAAGRHDFVAGEKLAPIYLRETAFVKAPPGRAQVV